MRQLVATVTEIIGTVDVPVGSAVRVGARVSVGNSTVEVGWVVGVVCVWMAAMVSTMAVCAAFGSTVGMVDVPPQARVASHRTMIDRMMGDFFIVRILCCPNDNPKSIQSRYQTKYPRDKNFLCKLILNPFSASDSAAAMNHCRAPNIFACDVSLADFFHASKNS